MEWGNIENIIWSLVVLLFLGLAVRMFLWRKKTREKFADSEMIQRIFPNTSHSRYWLKVVFASLALLFMVLALMDPLFGEEEVQVKREGIDLVYALDLSNSMYAEDIAPNRLEKAKKILSESINNLGGDRVGLIIFAADAFSVSPLTNDYNALFSYIKSASPDLIANQGTSFSEVAEVAKDIFSNSPTTGKILVILSDGEDNENSIKRAVQTAQKNKISIVSMGIGTAKGGPIPMESGGFEQYKSDRSGEVIISKLDETSLKDLASQTHGIYIPVGNTNETIEKLHQYINSYEKEVQDEFASKDKKHVFQWFLGLAVLFIFMESLTKEHRLFNN